MNNESKALSFEQSRKLLPKEFCPNEKLSGRKKLLQTPQGILSYHFSASHPDGIWKTSHNEEEIRNDIDYILFAIGFEGILLLSRAVLISFYDKNYKSRYSQNRYKINLYKSDGRYFWKGEGDERMDITIHFYPNK